MDLSSPITRLTSRRRTRAVLVALLLLAIVATVDGARTARQHRINDAIRSQKLPDEAPGQPRELQFARAALASVAPAASGAEEDVLNRYRALQDDTPLGQAARFNTANALMRQAITVRASPQPGLAIPLIELAKENYRELLRNDPSNWGARYNLERAQRLLPDPEDSEAPPSEAPSNAERAATTMRGYSPGLP